MIGKERFDYLGLMRSESAPENAMELVTPSPKGFLSRSGAYYAESTLSETHSSHANAVKRFTEAEGEFERFVLAENAFNSSCKAYYAAFKLALEGSVQAGALGGMRRVLDCDAERVVAVMLGREHGDRAAFPAAMRCGDEPTEGRFIEVDHKHILLSRALDVWMSGDEIETLVCPLYGAVGIGPFFKACFSEFGGPAPDYEHILFGAHDNAQTLQHVKDGTVPEERLPRLMLDEAVERVRGRSIAVFDDNVGTGETSTILLNTFKQLSDSVKLGTIELSWQYYHDIKQGNREGRCFDLELIGYPTLRNYRHHNFVGELVRKLKASGEGYLRALSQKGFQNEFVCDTDMLYNQGRSYYWQHRADFVCTPKAARMLCDWDRETKTNFVLSVDLLGGKVRYVERLPPVQAIELIRGFREVNIIDLDKYNGDKPNSILIRRMLDMAPCRVGGGIKASEEAALLLEMGAQKVIVGTHASPQLLSGLPKERVVVAIDSTRRENGRKRDVAKAMRELEPYCSEFQYVCVETDGKKRGGDVGNAIKYSKATSLPFNCVGGIASRSEMERLAKERVNCVVGRGVLEGFYG